MVDTSARGPSLASIAAEAGVSTASVSNAYNRPDRVSAALRARILRTARRQGYSGPNPAARQLRRGRADAVGLLFTSELAYAFHDPAAARFLTGLTETCGQAGLNLLLIAAPEVDTTPVGAVGNAAVDGFVVYSVVRDHPQLARIVARQLPTVVADAPTDLPGADWVGPDDRQAMANLATAVLAQGHRRLAVIGNGLSMHGRYAGPVTIDMLYPANYSVAAARTAGVRDALRAAGLPEPAVYDVPDNTHADGESALPSLLARQPAVTAVCCITDVLALGALDAARDRGLRIPDDLTITGFDDLPEAAARGLTTVAQSHVDKGRLAAQLLLATASRTGPTRHVIPTTIRIRDTSGPPRATSQDRA